MIGAIIGDIIGSRFEFNNTSDYNFELFHKDCRYTDDTICTVAIANALLKDKNYGLSLWIWGRNYPNAGYGNDFKLWLSKDFIDAANYSYGNGAVMRISPIGEAFDNDAEILREAIEATRVTHTHTEALLGAQAVSLLISKLKRDKASAIESNELERIATMYYGEQWEAEIPLQGEFNTTCQRCVPLAFKIIKSSNSFEDAIRKAVSYGGDSDTIAAIVGSIAEYYFGIPDDIKQRALRHLPPNIQEIINKFYIQYGT